MVSFHKFCGTVALALSFAGGAVAARAADVIKIDGSSTVYPVTEAVAEEFGAQNRGVRVTVGISGTGGGFKKFVRGETDIQDASRPILAQEMSDAKANGIEYIELPVAFDALTVVINPANTWAESITVDELKKMWEPAAQGKVMKWSDVRPGWPDAPLKLYGAGSDSGTFDYFTEATVGKAKSSRGDYTASEDDNVLVQGVASDKNALGYFGFAYYEANKDKLKAAKIDGGKGAVAPSQETVIGATYNPLSRPIFIYVNKKSLAKPEVKKFAEFYVENAAEMAKEVKYVPLPESAYAAAKARLDKQQTGTAFGGKSEVGLHIDELFKRELKN
jgi:phosphate transport system substrate-binding protein